MKGTQETEALAAAIRAGDRRVLARTITLVESARADHRARAVALLDRLAQDAAGTLHDGGALRIGLSGAPGVGKSTFIESFGLMLTGRRLRVAVLAVDPSSGRSGGSILGDKTRMERLSRDPHAFIRPSPSQAALGGVARRTREAAALCEAAGYDVIVIETVGVGQSEVAVAEMSDIFVLLLAPGGGDELQGVKRGIMEMADLVVVNKADGALREAAARTRADYAGALRLLRRRPQDPSGFPLALEVSAAEGTGLEPLWERIDSLARWRREEGHFAARRRAQAQAWFGEAVRQGLLARLAEDPAMDARMKELGAAVAAGHTAPAAAAERLLAALDASRAPHGSGEPDGRGD